jgi:hypothetical protein
MDSDEERERDDSGTPCEAAWEHLSSGLRDKAKGGYGRERASRITRAMGIWQTPPGSY